MIKQLFDTHKAEKLFGQWQETMIWSCLQQVMGVIYVDDDINPHSAMAFLGDFCFFAGKPNEEFVRFKPKECQGDGVIMVARHEAWAEMIEDYFGTRCSKITRYAIKKEGDIFDRAKLQAAVDALAPEYTIKFIDEEIYNYCKAHDWCQDLVSQYSDYQMFQKIGLGVVIIKDGEPISGASSYTSYAQGIEIEIDTRGDHRRKGLAYGCGAQLILECLKRQWYPSWDAHDLGSVALAEKLGYHFDHEYEAYEVMY